MNQLISGELKIGNTVRVLGARSKEPISGVVTGCINVVVFTGDDECYLGYSYNVRCSSWGVYTNKSVIVKYGKPMTLEYYKAYSRTPEAKANRLATYKSQPVVK